MYALRTLLVDGDWLDWSRCVYATRRSGTGSADSGTRWMACDVQRNVETYGPRAKGPNKNL